MMVNIEWAPSLLANIITDQKFLSRIKSPSYFAKASMMKKKKVCNIDNRNQETSGKTFFFSLLTEQSDNWI